MNEAETRAEYIDPALAAAGWGVGATMVTAWVLTIPASAAMGWVVYAILHTARLG